MEFKFGYVPSIKITIGKKYKWVELGEIKKGNYQGLYDVIDDLS